MSGGTPHLSRLPRPLRWGALLLLSAIVIAPLALMRIPASYMVGAIIAAIVAQVWGADLRLSKWLRIPAEALLGCFIAQAITPTAVGTFVGQAPLFLGIGLGIVSLSTLVGYGLLRMRSLPGPTAIWGLSPGAATVMTLMSGSFGADDRLVAFMQYLRVLIVAFIAPLVAHFWGTPTHAADAAAALAPAAFDWGGFAQSLAIAAAGTAVALRFRLPGGTILVPFALGAALHASGVAAIVLPGPLMALCYVLLGWSVGLNFTLPALRHALGTLPQVLAAILILVVLCGGLGVLLTLGYHIDPLSAYLATSPGGLSSVAIIAATSRVDLAFVIAMQTLRFVMVLALGPPIARFMTARWGQG